MALIDLHASRIIHCDLKPENIMFFGSEHKWKVLDLDSAVIDGQMSEVYPTLRYAAPEIAKAKQQGLKAMALGTSADMWSFGVILFEVMSGLATCCRPILIPHVCVLQGLTFMV